DADAERVGADLARLFLDEPEAHGGAVTLGQAAEDGLDPRMVAAALLLGDEPLVGARRGRDRLEREVAEPAGGGLRPPVVVDDLVLGDLPQPAVDALPLPAEAADLLDRGREGLAEDVFGGGAAEPGQDHRRVERIGVPAEDHAERVEPTGLRLSDEAL